MKPFSLRQINNEKLEPVNFFYNVRVCYATDGKIKINLLVQMSRDVTLW